jgi:two-component system chemotaxis response regulator CheY
MSTQGKHILIAEDSPGLAKVIAFNLEHAGFDVTVATDGINALEKAKQRRFDLVLTDQQMPRMEGTELSAELRELESYADVPIILLTAKAYELDAEHLKSTLDIVNVIPKPFGPKEIIETVEDALSPAVS